MLNKIRYSNKVISKVKAMQGVQNYDDSKLDSVSDTTLFGLNQSAKVVNATLNSFIYDYPTKEEIQAISDSNLDNHFNE